MKKLVIDVMVMGGVKFYCQLTYRYNPLFKINVDDVTKFVLEKRPTLKYQKGVVLVMDKKQQTSESLAIWQSKLKAGSSSSRRLQVSL